MLLGALIFALVTPSRAQVQTPLIPSADSNQGQSTGQAPTLEATMAFIQDKLNRQKPATWTYTDVFPGSVIKGSTSYVISEGKADPTTCVISWKSAGTSVGSDSGQNKHYGYTLNVWISFNLKDVKSIGPIVHIDGLGTRIEPSNRGPSVQTTVTSIFWTVPIKTASKAVTVLAAGRTSRFDSAEINFADEELAARMATAITHAADLCGATQAPSTEQ